MAIAVASGVSKNGDVVKARTLCSYLCTAQHKSQVYEKQKIRGVRGSNGCTICCKEEEDKQIKETTRERLVRRRDDRQTLIVRARNLNDDSSARVNLNLSSLLKVCLLVPGDSRLDADRVASKASLSPFCAVLPTTCPSRW